MGNDAHGRTEDLGASIERAAAAARHGDSDQLERELSHVGRLNSGGTASIATVLRRLARSVQAHPSYRATDTTRRAG